MKVVIVGAGEVGFHIGRHLALENKDVVLIDKDPEALRRVSESIDVQVMHGSGASPVVLEEAGIKTAEILLAVTDSDEANLVACLVANIISPSTKKLARVRDGDYDHFHAHFREQAPYIDTIINPDIEVVETIERLMSVPGAADVAEFADGRIKMVGVYLDKKARLAGIRLYDLPDLFGEQRPLIAAVVRDEKVIIPGGDDRLLPDDLVYFITEEEKLLDTLALFDKHSEPLRRVLIIGGGKLGFRLAARLDQGPLQTKIIDMNSQRCNLLAEKLNKAVVLCGDGTDLELLTEEHVQDIDVVVTLTDDDQTNIVTSLLARRMGAPKTITRISKFSHMSLMSTIGIWQVVSSRLSAINSILQHIRRGKVVSAISLKGEQAEVIEAIALETSDIVGKPLKNISFPKGALLAGIVRQDRIIIPTGQSVIEPEDRIIIFAVRQAIPAIEKILAVKLEYF